MSAQEWKDKGNNFLKAKDYKSALDCYTEAIKADPNDHIHQSNRSACYINLNDYQKALEDANQCIKLKPDWAKGYLRKGAAELGLDNHEEAKKSYSKGLELEPNNQQLKDGLAEIERTASNPFAKNYTKLFTDPRTSKYMSDPQFSNLLQYAMKDQKVLMQLVQSDPRFMDVFSVLTGIDLTMMNEQASKGKAQKEKDDKEKKIKDEENRKKAEEEKKKKEEEDKYNSLSNEEKEQENFKKQAEELKLKGNESFKQKNFDEALKFYTQALEKNPNELTYYLNKAGVYQELKEYDKVIEQCAYVADNTFDFSKKGRAYGRMGFAYQEKGDLYKAIEFFEKSLLENADRRIKDALKVVQDSVKKQESEKYINPEIAEEVNTKANDLYKAGKYPDALIEYNESIKRNPNSSKFYSNRAACYIKLMEFGSASNDCDKALELDPKFLRAIQRKATCQLMMKQYHKAIDTYEKGMKEFPGDQELKEGYYKVMNLINSTGTAEDDEARVKGAYADPEIQKIVMDPRIQQLFKDLKDNPKVAQDAIMKDEFIGGAFKKLVAAGIIKTK